MADRRTSAVDPAPAPRPDEPGARRRDRAADHHGRDLARVHEALPWRDPFQFHAVFQTSNNLRLDSPVRIAGVNVGKVVEGRAHGRRLGHGQGHDGDERGGPADPQGRDGQDPLAHLPRGQLLRRPDARHPERRQLDDGDTIPVTQTSTPVQLDQLLTALQTNDRESLQDLLKGLGDGLMRKPTAADDADQDPDRAGRDRRPSR